MNLHNLPNKPLKKSKRIGRGPGSGRGKTSTRGTKGQNARGKISQTHSHYEGGQRPLFKRLPYRRGKGNSKISTKPIIINLKVLNSLPKNTNIDLETLVKLQIVNEIDAKQYGIKILGEGPIDIPLNIELPISKSAQNKVEKAGGKITKIAKILNQNEKNSQQKPKNNQNKTK